MIDRIEHRDYLAAKATVVAYAEQENVGSAIPALAHLAYSIAREHCRTIELATLADIRAEIAEGVELGDSLWDRCDRFTYTVDADAYLLGSSNAGAYWETFREVAPTSELAAAYALEADLHEHHADELAALSANVSTGEA